MSHELNAKMAIMYSAPIKNKIINQTFENKHPQFLITSSKASNDELKEDDHKVDLNHAQNDSEEIEEIDLSSNQLLKKAIRVNDPKFYFEALTIDKTRQQLADRAEQLRAQLNLELSSNSKSMKSKYFGWKNIPWENNGFENSDFDNLWTRLKSSIAHEKYLLNNNSSKAFFNEIRSLMVGDELNELKSKYGNKHRDELDEYFSDYPQLWTPSFEEYQPFLLLPKPSKKSKPKKSDSLSTENKSQKKSIAQTKFENDIINREFELVKEMNKKFKANPIPISSLIPKYNEIMSTKGNKSSRYRAVLNNEKRSRLNNLFSNIIQEEMADLKRKESIKKKPKFTQEIQDYENEKKCGLTKEHTFHPAISSAETPNFKKLQQEFQKKLDKLKSQRVPTVPLPFKSLEKHENQSSKNYNQAKIKIQEMIEKSMAPNFKGTVLKKSTISDQATGNGIKIHETKAWRITLEHRRAANEALILAEEKEKKEHAEKLLKNKELSAKLRTKLKIQENGMPHDQKLKDNLERFKKAEKERSREHRKQLKEMRKRLSERLTLFEQAQVSNAKAKANQEFHLVLKNAGLELIS